MMKTFSISFLVSLSLFWYKCKSSTSTDSYDIVTFNVRLLHHSSENDTTYDLRRRAVIDMIAKSKADVMCLQEVWLPDDIDAIVKATCKTFPEHHRISVPAPNASRAPCESGPLNAYLTCVATNCPPAASHVEAFVCGFQVCRAEWRALGQECINCNALNNHLGSASFALCQQPGFRTSSTHGLLILSRKGLSDKTEFTYNDNETVLTTRGYLSAMVEDIGRVFCTHLSTYLLGESLYFGPTQFSNYAEDQTYQANLLFSAAAEATAKLKSPYSVLIAGDMNHGPKIGDRILARFPSVYNLALAHGYADPYIGLSIEESAAQCTFCYESLNPLTAGYVNGNQTYEGVAIDRVYVPKKDLSRVIRTQRLYDSPVVFENQSVYLSDHYAVLLEYLTGVSYEELLNDWRSAFAEWKQKFEDFKNNKC